jgi:hypothetical protein
MEIDESHDLGQVLESPDGQATHMEIGYPQINLTTSAEIPQQPGFIPPMSWDPADLPPPPPLPLHAHTSYVEPSQGLANQFHGSSSTSIPAPQLDIPQEPVSNAQPLVSISIQPIPQEGQQMVLYSDSDSSTQVKEIITVSSSSRSWEIHQQIMREITQSDSDQSTLGLAEEPEEPDLEDTYQTLLEDDFLEVSIVDITHTALSPPRAAPTEEPPQRSTSHELQLTEDSPVQVELNAHER